MDRVAEPSCGSWRMILEESRMMKRGGLLECGQLLKYVSYGSSLVECV